MQDKNIYLIRLSNKFNAKLLPTNCSLAVSVASVFRVTASVICQWCIREYLLPSNQIGGDITLIEQRYVKTQHPT